jgi:replicative DNA helicase/DNA primase
MKDERKHEIKSRMAEYLQSKGIDPNKNFPCLVHADNHPSMIFNASENRVRCFACKWSGDIFDLIGLEYGLQNHKEIFQKAEELFGRDTTALEARKQPEQHRNTPKPQKDYTAYFKRVQPQLRQTDYLLKRGISYEVAERAKVGFEPKFKFSVDGPPTPAIIIFTGQYSYTVRNTLPQVEKGDRVRKIGVNVLYMDVLLKTAKRPLIVVEGEIDALSVWEVGGCAMALGSINNDMLFVKRVAELKPDIQLVLSLDNDESGRAATVRVASELSALNIDFTVCNISGEYNDPSEALQFNREAFTKAVKGIYE